MSNAIRNVKGSLDSLFRVKKSKSKRNSRSRKSLNVNAVTPAHGSGASRGAALADRNPKQKGTKTRKAPTAEEAASQSAYVPWDGKGLLNMASARNTDLVLAGKIKYGDKDMTDAEYNKRQKERKEIRDAEAATKARHIKERRNERRKGRSGASTSAKGEGYKGKGKKTPKRSSLRVGK